MATDPKPAPEPSVEPSPEPSLKPAAKPSNVVTAFEAKTRFGTLLRRVAEGEEIIITRHDKVVARIVPEEYDRRARQRWAMEGLEALSRRIAARPDFKPLTDEEIRESINWGRKY